MKNLDIEQLNMIIKELQERLQKLDVENTKLLQDNKFYQRQIEDNYQSMKKSR